MRPALLALLLLAVPASAQSFNIDVGDNLIIFPVPIDSYAGAALQPGRWNSSSTPYSTSLVDLNGNSTGVTTSSNQTQSYNYFPSTLVGEDRNLMIDIQNLPTIGGPWTWTFNGLANGVYGLYTYAWAPENSGSQTLVTVAGSSDAPQAVGGSWFGGPHVFGVTYAFHNVVVSTGTISVQVEGIGSPGSVNAFQLVLLSGGTPPGFCFGDGTATACPCGNSGAPGAGCSNSVNPNGGLLTATGLASIANDTVQLTGSGMPNASALYFQGTTKQNGGNGSVFGDGLRCAGGTIIRLGTKTNAAGGSNYPQGGDLSVSVRGNCAPGNVRTYQVWYRNAATFCTASTFNLTNGVEITWST